MRFFGDDALMAGIGIELCPPLADDDDDDSTLAALPVAAVEDVPSLFTPEAAVLLSALTLQVIGVGVATADTSTDMLI